MSKVYVLTHCAAGENYTPRVFANKKDAQKALKEEYRNLIIDACDFSDDISDKDLEDVNIYIYSKHCSANSAEIVWDDDTYDRLDIFGVEIE